MVDWLAGNRVRGTSTERTTSTGFNDIPAISGGWKEVARTTLGSNGQTINVSSIPDKRYYMILHNYKLTNAGTGGSFRVGNGTIDSGSNYSRRKSQNGTNSTQVNHTNLMDVGGYSDTKEVGVSYIANLAGKEKLHLGHYVYGLVGAGSAPQRREWATKWTNTSNVIDTVEAVQGGSDNYTSGDEIVVLGWDPADTHTTNFWEELASDTASGSVASLESGTIASKKYLWIQCYVKTSASTFCETLFNNDTGSNYSSRASQNGGTDFTRTSQSDLNMFESYGNTTGAYINAFIVNNASNEKLGISHSVREGTSGAGNAPVRDENVFKWANTSDQITDISFTPQSGTINSGSILKVWGSD